MKKPTPILDITRGRKRQEYILKNVYIYITQKNVTV